MITSLDVYVTLLAYGIVLFPAAILSGVLWWRFIRGQPPVETVGPPQPGAIWNILDRWFPWRQWLPPWSGRHVLWCFFLYLFVPMSLYALVNGTLGTRNLELDDRGKILITILAYLIVAGLWLLLLLRTSETQLFQLGIHSHRWPQAVLSGRLFWIVLTPVVLGVHFLTLYLTDRLGGTTPESHPLTRMMEGSQQSSQWILLVMSALVVVPFVEELFFRNLLQRLITRYKWSAHLTLVGCLCLILTVQTEPGNIWFLKLGFWLVLLPAYVMLPGLLPRGKSGYLIWQPPVIRREQIEEPQIRSEVFGDGKNMRFTRKAGPFTVKGSLSEDNALQEDEPIVISNMSPFFNPLVEDLHSNRVRGIFTSAMFFAILHQWPTCIPLFVLGLLLGWLAYRTQSLISTLVFHSLFNAVPCVIFVLCSLFPEFESAIPK